MGELTSYRDAWLEESWDPDKLAAVARRVGVGLMVVAEERERADGLAERLEEQRAAHGETAEELALEAGAAKLAAHEYRQQAELAIGYLQRVFALVESSPAEIGDALWRKLEEQQRRWQRAARTWPARGTVSLNGEAVLEVVVPLAPDEPEIGTASGARPGEKMKVIGTITWQG